MGIMVETRGYRKNPPDQGGYVPPPSQFGNSGFKAFAGTAVAVSDEDTESEEPETKGLSVIEVFEKIKISDPQRSVQATFDELIRGDVEFVPVVAESDPEPVDQDDPAWVTRTTIRCSEKRRRLFTMTGFVVLAVLIVAGMMLICERL